MVSRARKVSAAYCRLPANQDIAETTGNTGQGNGEGGRVSFWGLGSHRPHAKDYRTIFVLLTDVISTEPTESRNKFDNKQSGYHGHSLVVI